MRAYDIIKQEAVKILFLLFSSHLSLIEHMAQPHWHRVTALLKRIQY